MAEEKDASNLEAMQFAVAYQRAMRRLVAEKLSLPSLTGMVLDFGAGRGDYAVELKLDTPSTIISFEPNTRLHMYYPQDHVVVGELDALAPDSLDAAYSLNVFEHIEDDAQALRLLLAKCKPGALVFILVPANMKLWTPMDSLVGHHRRYMPEGLVDLGHAANARVLQSGWFDRTGYLATLGYRAVSALKPSSPNAGTVSGTQMRVFDNLFKHAEPVFSRFSGNFGKNCWVLLQKP